MVDLEMSNYYKNIISKLINFVKLCRLMIYDATIAIKKQLNISISSNFYRYLQLFCLIINPTYGT